KGSWRPRSYSPPSPLPLGDPTPNYMSLRDVQLRKPHYSTAAVDPSRLVGGLSSPLLGIAHGAQVCRLGRRRRCRVISTYLAKLRLSATVSFWSPALSAGVIRRVTLRRASHRLCCTSQCAVQHSWGTSYILKCKTHPEIRENDHEDHSRHPDRSVGSGWCRRF